MNNFIYNAPTKIYFGRGEEEKIGELIAAYAPKKVLIHYGGQSAEKSGLLSLVRQKLDAVSVKYIELGGVVANPELQLVREGINLCIKEGVDFILAVGGGSVIDSAKAIANGAANPEVDVWDFHLGKCAPKKSIKKAAILTLAAAGSEMSPVSVISNRATGEKRSNSNSLNLLEFAIMDPALTFTVNKYQTACGAVDIAMHTMERYFCPGNDTYLTDAIAEAVIKSVMKAGLDAFNNPEDYEARANMMWASSLAHNGLTGCGRKTQLVVHQLEHELSGLYPEIAHGAGLAALWCSWARYVYRYNIPRWLQYSKNIWNLDIDFEHPVETIEKAISLQEDYYRSIGMPINLKMLGVEEDKLEFMALQCSRNKTRSLIGYKELAYEDMLEILKIAYSAGN